MNDKGGAVINRLEIDIMQVNEITESLMLAYKHSMPSVVVHPSLSSDVIMARSRMGGKFKIITPVDWPRGETFGLSKFTNLSFDSIDADGFEIVLTPGKTKLETKNEALSISAFIKKHVGQSLEIRFVLNCTQRTDDEILSMCEALTEVSGSTMIRTDISTKLQQSKANSEIHTNHIRLIKSVVGNRIKLSGNITLKSINSCERTERYAVNLSQAKSIIKELANQDLQEVETLVDEKAT